MSFRLVPKSVTFSNLERQNGPYFAFFSKFGSFRGALRKRGWQSHNYGQFMITMSSSKRLQRDRATPTVYIPSRFLNSILRPNAYYLPSYRLDIGSRIWAFDWYQNRWPWMTLNGEMALILRYFTEFGSFRGVLRKRGWQSHNWTISITMSSSKRLQKNRATPTVRYKYYITVRWKFCSRFNAQYLPSYHLICQTK